jgi:nonribosomal peptide synthetase DhbF
VTAVSVVLRGDPTADGHLAAYIAAEARPGLAEDVWSYARERLPAYSLPGRIVVVDALPQTPNGKVDVNRLAALEPREPAPAGPAAADGLEDRLVDAWAEVLGRSGVAPDTNFFLTGGTSLLAVRLAVTASRISGTEVTMGMVFRAPTPAALAQMITTRAAS